MLKSNKAIYLVLTILFVAGYSLSAFATGTNSIVAPTPDPNWDLKAGPDHIESDVPYTGGDAETGPTIAEQEQTRLASKISDYKPSSVPAYSGLADLMTEGFEGGVMPPTGWSVVVNNAFTWDIYTTAYEGTYSASCVYDENYTGNQDEWMISPSFDLTGISDAVLDFWWQGSYYWSVDPYPNCTLSVMITTDAGTTWNPIWTQYDYGVFENWTFYNTVLDLSAYVDQTCQIAIVYTGYDGAQFIVDAISVNNNPAATGRCCYGDPLAPDCDDLTLAECDALSGSWDETLDCTTACPVAGPGDNCSNPNTITIPADYPYTDAGQFTCGRGNDYAAADMCYGTGYGGGEDIVYELTVTEPVTIKMTMDPKGTTWTYVEIRTDCPPSGGTAGACIYYFRNTGSDLYLSDNVSLDAGTYYIIIDTWPSPDCIADFDFSIEDASSILGRCCYGDPGAPSCDDVTLADCTTLGGEWDETKDCTTDPCPILGPGDGCAQPLEIKVPGDLPYVDENYTCARLNDYENTCLGSYDSGEDIIYWLDVDSPVDVDIFLDPRGTTYTGIAVGATCPLPEGTDDCVAKATGSSGTTVKELRGVHLEPGSYYIMIDTWAAPDCIPDFELTIEPAAAGPENDDWDKCTEVSDVVDFEFTTATASFDGPGGCQTAPNVWFCYTATCDGQATASLCGSGYDTKMAVYDGIDPNTAAIIECNDDFCSVQSEITFPVVSGNTYLVEVGGYSSNTGSGVLNMSCVSCDPLPNDHCEDVTPVAITLGTPETFTGSNVCADNDCSAQLDNPMVWEAFTIAQGADVAISYCGTTPAWGNGYIVLVDGCPCDGATLVYADNWSFDDCGDGNVSIYWPGLPAGTYYYPVMLDPTNAAEGDYSVTVFASSAELTFDINPYDFGLVAPGSTGSGVLTLGAIGSRDINFDINILWGDKSASTGNGNNLLSATKPVKAPYSGPDAPASQNKQGGEGFGDAFGITLPYTGTGTNVGYLHDIDIDCEYGTSTAPDVVYVFTVPAGDNMNLTVDMFGSAYDTKIGLFDAAYAMVDCNDDYYSDYVSAMFNVEVTAGETYYIVIGGYGASSGDYAIDAFLEVLPNPFECPAGVTAELEACGDDTNGGCNMVTPTFEPIACNDTVCGTVWADGDTRDTDWYLLTMYETGPVTFTAQAAFPLVIGFADTADCALVAALDPYATGNANDIISVTRTCGPGEYVLFVSHQEYTGYPCGTDNGYWCVAECDAGTAPIIWLDPAVDAGVVPAGGTFPLTLNYDVTELPMGVHTAQLVFTHDGNRAEDIIPVTIEVGNLGNSILTCDPDTIYAIMLYSIGDTMQVSFYLGGEFAGGGYVVGDIDLGAGLTVNGTVVPNSATVLPTYEGFTGEVLQILCQMSDFIGTYPLLWDVNENDYTVEGSFSGGGSFAETAMVPMIGHTSGDANFDGNVNILDATYIISSVYLGGPLPQPIPETGDVDGNNALNILDVTKLIGYLYAGGAAPSHP